MRSRTRVPLIEDGPALRGRSSAVAVPILLSLALAACGGEPATEGRAHCPGVSLELPAPAAPALDLAAPEVAPENLRAWIDALSAPGLRGRHATSDDARAVSALLADHVAALGLAAPYPGESYCQDLPRLGAGGYNVVAHLAAGGAAAPRRAVLLGAHYDGQGLHPAGLAYPSADDNASGVAALLEVARLAGRRSWPFDLVFVAFNAEEIGRLGAETWAQEPTTPLSGLLLMINFDMVGRPWPGSPPEAIGYRAAGTAPDFAAARLAEAAAASGVEVRELAELFAEEDMTSDSDVFSPYVPTLYLSTGLHEDHHERTDTPERVEVAQTARAVRLVMGLLERLSSS